MTRETDARGNHTTYVVDENTSRMEEVTDREGNKTRYEYDNAGRTTRVASCDASGAEIGYTAYEYDALGDMTAIMRGDGQKYYMTYNHYHRLESIGIGGKGALVTNMYKEGTDKLKSVTYANGHVMRVKYNASGQIVSEKWFANSSTQTPMAYYQYAYDGEGNVIRSLDILDKKMYTYKYEGKQLLEVNEWTVTVNNEQVQSKTAVCKVYYRYDEKGFLTRKVIQPTGGDEVVYYYKNVGGEDSESAQAQMKITLGGRTITSRSKSDAFGRKTFDELELGVSHLYRRFTYHDGETPTEHVENEKTRSMATTQLVKEIVLSDGRTLSYEYDKEERITKVTDSVDGVTEYTYDAQGQLLTETFNGELVNVMTYDAYGNILTKNGVTYGYSNSAWKDQLTSFGGSAIVYDAQGNPTTYLGHTLTWEKGRQLKKFVKTDGTVIDYTYNANGIRTSKTVGGVKHDYVLDGTKIIRETWGNNDLVPVYDNEDSVCGIVYNSLPYYFVKNLQGDVIAIVNKDAQTVARYSYDAWGVPEIKADTSGCSIATINPFRYRSYYYDEETDLYYLQSRYYDASVGRFLNTDHPEIVLSDDKFLTNNTYSYCYNDPINNLDPSGNVIASTIAKIILGILFGLLVQFIGDLIVFVCRRLIEGQNATFNPALGDYVGSALTWGLASVNPFGKKYKVLAKLFNFVPVIAKYACKFIRNEKIYIFDLITDLLAVFVSLIVSSAISKNTANKIKNLKKLNRSKLKTPSFKFKKMEIKYAGKILNQKFSFALNLSPTIIETIFHCIVGV